MYIGEEEFDALAVVQEGNKSMKASDEVVKMLVELYESQNAKPMGEGGEF
ncbi:hypothetical protein [Pseudomonas sp. JZ134]